MAIYHCTISNVSRAKGSSSCATLSYICAEKIYEERTAQTYSYGRRERVIATGTIIPECAPQEYVDPSVLFNAIENYEKAENARTAKKIEVALPREFDTELQIEVIEQYISDNLTKEGYCATFAIHHDKDNNNPHAHILIANRQLNEMGEWSTKSKKEYALDENGERIPLFDKEGNQKLGKRNEKLWKRVSVQVNPLDKKEFLQQLRQSWADVCNQYLVQENELIDHRSLAEQGVDRIPTIHEGYASREMEKRGLLSERAEINRNIREKNNLLSKLLEGLKKLRETVLASRKTEVEEQPQETAQKAPERQIDRVKAREELRAVQTEKSSISSLVSALREYENWKPAWKQYIKLKDYRVQLWAWKRKNKGQNEYELEQAVRSRKQIFTLYGKKQIPSLKTMEEKYDQLCLREKELQDIIHPRESIKTRLERARAKADELNRTARELNRSTHRSRGSDLEL